MIIYVPHLIQSAEQAEALPIGTLAILPDGLCHRQILTKTNNGPGPWEVDMHGYPHVALLGWTALVPIEAEEERTRPVHLYAATVHVSPTSSSGKPSRRLVTPWEEAQ